MEKKKLKMPRSFAKHFLLPHICAKCFAAFCGGSSDPPGSAQICPLQRTADFEGAVTLSSYKVASSGCSEDSCWCLPRRIWFSTSAGDAEDGQASWRHGMDGPSQPTPIGFSLPRSWKGLSPSLPSAVISPGSALIKRSRTITSDLGLTFVKTYNSSSVSPMFWTFIPTTLKAQICQNTQRCCQRLSNSF